MTFYCFFLISDRSSSIAGFNGRIVPTFMRLGDLSKYDLDSTSDRSWEAARILILEGFPPLAYGASISIVWLRKPLLSPPSKSGKEILVNFRLVVIGCNLLLSTGYFLRKLRCGNYDELGDYGLSCRFKWDAVI